MFIKRFGLLILSGMLIFSCSQQPKVQSDIKNIPDPKKSDGGYISNPDGLMDQATAAELNAKLMEIDKEDKAQVAIVILKSIGENQPKDFAHRLFNYWKVGKQEKNNGLLILIVKDQRRVEFETGYGLEGDLPDAICFRIQQDYMMPYLKSNDFNKAVVNGVKAIVNHLNTGKYDFENAIAVNDSVMANVDTSVIVDSAIYSDSSANDRSTVTDESIESQNISLSDKETIFSHLPLLFLYLFLTIVVTIGFDRGRPKQEEADEPVFIFRNEFYSSSWISVIGLGIVPIVVSVLLQFYTSFNIGFWMFLVVVYSTWVVFVYLYYAILNVKVDIVIQDLSRNDQYVKLALLHKNLKIFTCLFPLPFLVFYRRRILAKLDHLRNDPYVCFCGNVMYKLDERADNKYLNKAQREEERLRSVDYDVWKCNNCSHQLILDYENVHSTIRICSSCNAKTLRMTRKRTITRATESIAGKGCKHFHCNNCNTRIEVGYIIPKISRSSSGRSGSSSSSSSSSSSWGGGSSGGGGAGSSW